MLDNAAIAELLSLEAEKSDYPLKRAYRRASRKALLWEIEASELVQAGRSLIELSGIGPYIEKRILRWMDAKPTILEIPVIRKGFLTLTQARAALKKQPKWLKSIRGDLQMHTIWSDGSASIAEMARAASERSYQFLAITDHSKGLKIAGGIDEAQLQKQSAEIKALNRKFVCGGTNLTLLRSIELNLNPAGQGDMSSASLRTLDLVLGCFHSSLRRNADQTPRYLAALRNPDIQILGHPRGRIYNFREGLLADWQTVFSSAADLGKAVEIDGYPDRQDLNIELLRLAKSTGVRISLGTDSHGPTQLGFMEFCAAAALIAEIPAERILNCMDKDALCGWVDDLRSKTQPSVMPRKKTKIRLLKKCNR